MTPIWEIGLFQMPSRSYLTFNRNNSLSLAVYLFETVPSQFYFYFPSNSTNVQHTMNEFRHSFRQISMDVYIGMC